MDERREVRAKVRTYKDKATGEDKNVYATIGAAWVSEHGSKIRVTLDTTPVNWDGTFFINKPYEKKEQGANIQKDEVILPTDDEISLSDIPF